MESGRTGRGLSLQEFGCTGNQSPSLQLLKRKELCFALCSLSFLSRTLELGVWGDRGSEPKYYLLYTLGDYHWNLPDLYSSYVNELWVVLAVLVCKKKDFWILDSDFGLGHKIFTQILR